MRKIVRLKLKASLCLVVLLLLTACPPPDDPPAPTTVSLTANGQSGQITVNTGTTITLEWSIQNPPNSASCKLLEDSDSVKEIFIENKCTGEKTVTPIPPSSQYSIEAPSNRGVSISASVLVKVSDTPISTLRINKQGSGTVTSTPAGINCGGTCTASFDTGTEITLSASPGNGFSFTGWTGDCTGTSASCQLTLSEDSNVGAIFKANTTPSNTLSINKKGEGTVSSLPAGIDCGRTCTASFTTDTEVKLSASPASGFDFGGWTGDCTGTTTTCTLKLTEDSNVGAIFNLTIDGTLDIIGNGSFAVPILNEAIAPGTTKIYRINTPALTQEALIVELNQPLQLRVYDSTKTLFASSSSSAFFASGNDGITSSLTTQGITISVTCRGSCVYQNATGIKTSFVEISNSNTSAVSYDLYIFSEAYQDTGEIENNLPESAPILSGDDSGALESIGDVDYYQVTTKGALRLSALKTIVAPRAQILDSADNLLTILDPGQSSPVAIGNRVKVFSNNNRAAASANSSYSLNFIGSTQLAQGKAVYDSTCLSGCHGTTGTGVNSVNLADYDDRNEILEIITTGSMMSASSSLSSTEKELVSDFVALCFPKNAEIGCP